MEPESIVPTVQYKSLDDLEVSLVFKPDKGENKYSQCCKINTKKTEDYIVSKSKTDIAKGRFTKLEYP